MKVLWITSSGWKEGGAENYLYAMRPLVENRGHVVKIFASDSRPDQKHFSDYHFKAYEYGVFAFFFRTLNPWAYISLKKVLKDFRPDIVHIHTIGFASPAILFLLRKYPTILTMHGPEGFMKSLLIWCFPSSCFVDGEPRLSNLNLSGWARLLYHRVVMDPLYHFGLRTIDTIISPSRYMQDLVRAEGRESVLVSNGMTLFQESPVERAALRHTLAFVGRLEKNKGVSVLIDAMQEVLKSFPDAVLHIAGDGTERPALEEQVRRLGLERAVVFLGRINRENLQEVYARAMVVVMPSVWVEAFGLVGVEAMSVGRPVVAANIGGVSDWLEDGKNGLLVPAGDSAAIAQAVKKMFSDPDLLLRLMQAARKKSEEFGLEAHVDVLLGVYNDTIRKHGGVM